MMEADCSKPIYFENNLFRFAKKRCFYSFIKHTSIYNFKNLPLYCHRLSPKYKIKIIEYELFHQRHSFTLHEPLRRQCLSQNSAFLGRLDF